MKPPPPARPRWPLVGLILGGSALILWGCGHTREVLYPQRKTSPPRGAKGRPAPARPTLVDPDLSPPARPARQPDAPTAVDVPMINRDDT